jgi:hypothetical protein
VLLWRCGAKCDADAAHFGQPALSSASHARGALEMADGPLCGLVSGKAGAMAFRVDCSVAGAGTAGLGGCQGLSIYGREDGDGGARGCWEACRRVR